MARLVFRILDALALSSRCPSSARHKSKGPRSPHVLAIHRGGELLESRSVPSTTPIVGAPVAVSGFETAPLTNVPVATFTQGDGSAPASNFLTMIFWGDGTSSAGTVVAANGMYAVVGSHTYTDVSQTSIVVGIEDATTPTNFTYVSDQTFIAPLLPDGTSGTVDQRFVYEYLKDTLQRPISMGEVNYWTAQYEKNHRDAQTFGLILLESTPPYEYRRGEIDNSYKTYLHRAADPAGENYFLQLVINLQGTTSGPGEERRTSALLINSDEYYYQRAGGTLDGFINAVFEDALKRAPTVSDLAYFEFQLTHGMTHIEFATTILNSYEFEVRQINSLYERYLGRPADPAGLAAFVFNSNVGYGTESNTETLLDTPEFYDRAVGLPLGNTDVP